MFFVFIHFFFVFTSRRLYSFCNSLPQSSMSGMLESWMQIRPWLWLFLSQANISTSTFCWNCGEHSDVIVGRILLSFSFEISMTNSQSLFDLIVAGLLPTSQVKLISIAHGLIVLFFSIRKCAASGAQLCPNCGNPSQWATKVDHILDSNSPCSLLSWIHFASETCVV